MNREDMMVRRFAADVCEATAFVLLIGAIILWARVLAG
jgi:hypothetical protein